MTFIYALRAKLIIGLLVRLRNSLKPESTDSMSLANSGHDFSEGFIVRARLPSSHLFPRHWKNF